MIMYNIQTSVDEEIDFQLIESIDFVFEYDSTLLVFLTETDSHEDETAVHSFDTVNQTWTRLKNLKGSASYNDMLQVRRGQLHSKEQWRPVEH